MFTKAQLDRYARHIILPGVGVEGQRTLLASRVLVVGAGGLGSPALLYLAAGGVGTLGIIDADTVELTNLQRQVIHRTPDIGLLKTESARQAVHALNPEVKLIPYPFSLDSHNARSVIRDFDLVIDGSDNFPTRYLVNDACVLEGKPLVYGAVSRFEGQVSLLHALSEEGMGPCYRCLFPTPPAADSILSCADAGVLGVLPGVIGSLMAVEALKALLNIGTPLAGTLLHYDALAADLQRFTIHRDPECPGCGEGAITWEARDYETSCR